MSKHKTRILGNIVIKIYTRMKSNLSLILKDLHLELENLI